MFMEKIKSVLLTITTLLLSLVSLGYYRSRALREADARARAEANAQATQRVNTELVEGEKRYEEKVNAPVDRGQFTHQPK